MTRSHIVSVTPASSGLFRQELLSRKGSRLLESLDEWRHLCEFDPQEKPLFALHRFAVELEVGLERLCLDTVLEALLAWAGLSRLGDEPFGVQVTANLRMPWSFAELIEQLLERSELPSSQFVPRSPQQVLSVYLHQGGAEGRLFVGISTPEENLSPWSSGQCRIPRDPNSISRAEAKLIEGWEAFGMTGLRPGMALDLGAAPGGWSRVLADLGYEVHSVDPAILDERLEGRVHFHQETAGRYLSKPGPNFDLLVCDMKMEATKVAEMLLGFQPRLNPGSKIFTTFKLGKGKHALSEAQNALQLLQAKYRLEAARQLFFNRSEISALLANPS